MKAIVTAVHDDGAQWGWPGEPVYRYLGEDGSWAWVPQPSKSLSKPGDVIYTIGDVIDIEDGWEWLDDDKRARAIARHKQMTGSARKAQLRAAAEQPTTGRRADEHHSSKKTPAQLDREITESLADRQRRGR